MGYSEKLKAKLNDRTFMKEYETATGLRRSRMFDSEGDLNLGIILADEGTSEKDFRMTPFEMRVKSKEAFPLLFEGDRNKTGKAALRFCRELAAADCGRIIVVTDDRRFRSLILNGRDSFRFYSMGNAEKMPICMNPCRIPDGIDPQRWIDMLVSVWCRAYGVLERGKRMLDDVLYRLYEQAGCFDDALDASKRMFEIGKRSEQITFHKVYKELEFLRDSAAGPGRRLGNDAADGYERLLERLSCFSRPYSTEYRLFSSETDFSDPKSVGTGSGIDALTGNGKTIVFETRGMEETFRKFVSGFIAHAVNMISDADDSSAKPTFLFTDEDAPAPSRWNRGVRPAISAEKAEGTAGGRETVVSASGEGFPLPENAFLIKLPSGRTECFTPADCEAGDFLLSEDDLYEKTLRRLADDEESRTEKRRDGEYEGMPDETRPNVTYGAEGGSDLFRKIAEDAKMKLAVLEKETRNLCVKMLLKTFTYDSDDVRWARLPASDLIRRASEALDGYAGENVRLLERMMALNAEKDETIAKLRNETERLADELRKAGGESAGKNRGERNEDSK